MKIVHVVHGFSPEFIAGTEVYCEILSRRLLERGHECLVLTGSEGCAPEATLATVDQDGLLVTRYLRADGPPRRWIEEYDPDAEGLTRRLLTLVHPDVVHLHHWQRLTNNLVAICADLGIPVVVTLHDVWTSCPKIHRIRWDGTFCAEPPANAPCLSCVERSAWQSEQEITRMLSLRREMMETELALADAIIVPSEAHRTLLLSLLDLPQERLVVLPHGSMPTVAPNEGRQGRLAFPNRPLQIGHWGYLTYPKGTHLILEAVQKLRDPSAVQVYLFGTTIEQEYEQQLRDLARGISVQFHGAYGPADLQAFDLDLAVFASITSESYSFTLDEALRLGLPVLVSDRGALPERIGEAGLTFRAGDAENLAQRLQEILDKPELLDMMRRNIRPDTLYSMEAHVAMLEKIYGDATSTNKPKQDSTAPYLQLLAHAMRQVQEREQQMQALGQEVERLHAQMAEAVQEVERLHAQMAEAVQEVERLHAQMADMQSSLAWWLAVRIQQVKSRLFPLNTRRGKLCEGTLQKAKEWLTITPALDARAVCDGAAAGAMTCTRPLAHLVQRFRNLKTQWSSVLEPRLMRMLHCGRQSVGKSSSYYVPSTWTPLSFPSSLNPKVSIVIPAFNAHLYTYACLRSIVNAVGCTSYEVIVVDGSSQDETPRMLETMQGIRVIRDERNEGASVAYNAAATAARGEYLLFLNNDIVVLNGWLEAMLDTYATHDNVGAVGAKLIYPDGRLQEAGGILWQDGSVRKYGCFDDPEKPEYNYVREVDYCSGVCVMIQRNLFEQLEGFAGRYAPACYEAIDLCLRVRAAGFKMMYQPAAVVVHCEGVSSGKDAAQVSEPHQVLDQRQFYSRWAHLLRAYAANGVSPHTEKERNVKKRVLIVDDHVLRPDQDSGSLRMWNLIQLWQSLSFKVTFAAANLERVEPYVRKLQRQGAEVLYAPFVSSLKDHLREFGPLYDVVLLSRPDVGTALLGTVRATCPRALVMYDSPDLYFLREMRQAQVSRNFRLGMLARIRKQQEFRLFQQADIALVVSPVEQCLVTKELPAAHVEVISNIHDIYGSARPFYQRTDLLFVGGFAHTPNVDAVQYFVREIFPLLRSELPDVKFYIVGSDPPPEVVALAGEDVIVTGYKEDIVPYFANCRVFLAPLRYGAGVKGKINMSMSHGLPVVATPLAVEGMRLVNEWDVLIGETAHEFSSSVVRVYKDEELWSRLSSNGIENVRRFYSREVARATLERILGEDNLSAVQTYIAN